MVPAGSEQDDEDVVTKNVANDQGEHLQHFDPGHGANVEWSGQLVLKQLQ